jgi:hypothetical protein
MGACPDVAHTDMIPLRTTTVSLLTPPLAPVAQREQSIAEKEELKKQTVDGKSNFWHKLKGSGREKPHAHA